MPETDTASVVLATVRSARCLAETVNCPANGWVSTPLSTPVTGWSVSPAGREGTTAKSSYSFTTGATERGKSTQPSTAATG